MKPYVLSLAVGLLVGVIYALFQVRSPAPPVIALVGLLGILLGEQIPPLVKQWFPSGPPSHSWLHHQVKPHMFGPLPTCTTPGSGRATPPVATAASSLDGHPSRGEAAAPRAETGIAPAASAPHDETRHG